MKSLTIFILFLVSLTSLCFSETTKTYKQGEGALNYVKGSVDEIINVIETMKKGDKEKRRAKISSVFYESFDPVRLTAMTLKSSWKELDNDQKKAFTKKYSEFVLSFYANKLESYNNNKVVYSKEEYKSGGKKAVVFTMVEFEGAMAKVNYSLAFKNDAWKIYDVEVEGVRLTSTYRSQFQSLLKKKSFEKVLEEMDKLIKKQEAS